MNDFGDFLYELRKEKGLTQAKLAELLGVTNKAVSKWETGEAMPETAQLKPISKIFGVSVDELLEGKRNGSYDDAAENRGSNNTDSKNDEISRHLFTRGKDENKTLADKICGAVCAALISSAIIAYLVMGIIANLWNPFWVILPTAALLCGIIGIIFDMCNAEKRNRKIQKGENPFCGGACGLLMLVCIISYLNIGAFFRLWHPYWIIIVAGALLCGVVCSVFAIISHKK